MLKVSAPSDHIRYSQKTAVYCKWDLAGVMQLTLSQRASQLRRLRDYLQSCWRSRSLGTITSHTELFRQNIARKKLSVGSLDGRPSAPKFASKYLVLKILVQVRKKKCTALMILLRQTIHFLTKFCEETVDLWTVWTNLKTSEF